MLKDKQKDIVITTRSHFEDDLSNSQDHFYMFTYTITIENNTNSPIQLLSRHWEIFDSLSEKRTVDGEGVVGEKPIIHPGDSYQYTSGCDLFSDYGSMKGFYQFMNLDIDEEFIIEIPKFELKTFEKLN